ncbi:DUF397 domain-containing protein [Nocardia sp. NPDC051570]|uniref:DUF397 domain-containing protein n=1 Tax=Nocardia sp. NPDC051570 TaxID=3364324 RepID=UPI00378A3DA0
MELKAMWRKSSYSSGEGQCVEVRFDTTTILLRDSKFQRNPANDPAAQPIITLPSESWPVFLDLAMGHTTEQVPGIASIDHHRDGGVTIHASDGTTLTYTSAEWTAFTSGIRDGEFAAA